MTFTSLEFGIFFIIFFILYWAGRNKSVATQNFILLAGNLIFYGFWNLRFLALLLFSSLLSFLLGNWISKITERKRWIPLWIGLLQLLGTLIFFKYYNFFADSLVQLSAALHVPLSLPILKLILPLGISFYTFRIISYLLDVKNEKIAAEKNAVIFLNYTMFFPSLTSGPIDKAKLLIPQLEKKRVFEYAMAVDGLKQILWGFFKKAVIADNCGVWVDKIFGDYGSQSSLMLFTGAFLYTIQLYADFSGYSDMAIGVAKLLGFRITKNFDFPFFSQNIAEFWRKWHISLTNWLTEYVFTPLSITFRDWGKTGLIVAILVNFTLIGIWHGDNWTFILFGFLHGCYFVPLIINGTMNKKRKKTAGLDIKSVVRMKATFLLVMFTFILFRSEQVSDAFFYIKRMFTSGLFIYQTQLFTSSLLYVLAAAFALLIIEWRTKENNYTLEKIGLSWPPFFRISLYYVLIAAIYLFSVESEAFIYFQF